MRTLWIAAIALASTAIGATQQDAKALLKQVQQKYRNAKTWDMKVDITFEIKIGANAMKQQITSTLAIQRPNRIAAKLSSSGVVLREVYSDGKTVYLYNPSTKQYMKMAAANEIGSSTAQLLGEVGMLLSFLDQDLDKLGADTQFQMRGTETVAGKRVQVVEIRQKLTNGSSVTRVFIGTQDRLVYRVEYTETLRTQSGQGSNAQPLERVTTATANLQYLSFNKPIPASRFQFKPPKDAKEMPPPQLGAPMAPQPPQGGR
ncbi:MAG: LolA family protein [Fimbriimonadales bacterium]